MHASAEGISVVIPNYNGRALLEQNLPSVFQALENTSLPWEVIVADDCSDDDSVEYLKTRRPEVRIVHTARNAGFSTACNTGIAAVNHRYTCIANSDVTFGADYFVNALPCFKETGLFAVKGDIVNYGNDFDDIKDINKDIVVYFKYGFFKFKDVYKIQSMSYDYRAVLLGGCFLCRTALMRKMGGFDEIFSPFYKEDLDLAMRAVERGYTIKYVPGCRIHHKIGSTINTTQVQWKKYLISKRNKFLLAWKHITTVPRWLNHCFFVALSLMFRWIILDWKWYAAFFYALYRKLTFRPRHDETAGSSARHKEKRLTAYEN